MPARSRRGGGIGQGVFTQTPTPSCPPGQHWENPPAAAVRGLGACVPNTVQLTPLTFRPAAPAPPPAPPTGVQLTPLTFQPPPSTAASAPAPTDTTAAPAPAPTPLCPTPWSWWWLLVAFGVGYVAGGQYIQNEKKAGRAIRRNVGRIANLAAHRAVHVGVGRLLG